MRDVDGEEVNEKEERKLKKNDWGNITRLQEKGKGESEGGQTEGN